MTRPGSAARPRPGAFALGLALAVVTAAAQAADGFTARDGTGNPFLLLGHTLGTMSGTSGTMSYRLPLTGLTDAFGIDIGPTNPLRVAPGIEAATAIDRGGPVTGSPQTPMVANAARKGGWIVADPADTGTIYVSYTGAATATGGAGDQCALTAGGSCPLTVNGYVIQSAVTLIGTVAGDKFEAVEFQ